MLEGIQPIRVFARSGEITDGSIIQRFEIRDSSSINFYSDRNGVDTIRILDNHEARLSDPAYANYTYKMYLNEVKFIGKDTTTEYTSAEVYSRTMYYYLAYHKPEIFKEYAVSSTAGAYTFGCRTRNEYRFVKNNDKLKSPYIVALLHPYGFGTRAYWLQNKLDPNFYQHLADRDTIVLREHFIMYEQ